MKYIHRFYSFLLVAVLGCAGCSDAGDAGLAGAYCLSVSDAVPKLNAAGLRVEDARGIQARLRERESLKIHIARDGAMSIGEKKAHVDVRFTFPAAWWVDVKQGEQSLIHGGNSIWIVDAFGDIEIDGAGTLGATPDACMHGLSPSAKAWGTIQPPPLSGAGVKTPAAEDFMGLPHEKWPQLVLTNAAHFTDGRTLQGASAFLASVNGQTLAITAAHLLGPSGGVVPPVELASFQSAFVDWTMFPRTTDDAVHITGLAMDPPSEDLDFDAVALALAEGATQLPAKPLHLRETPVQLGERVYLVGCAYADQACKQRVYPATVSGRRGTSAAFRFDLDEPVNLRGFSGAPILDANGHVVGAMSVSFPVLKVGDAFLTGGGYDASQLLGLIR